MGYGLWAMWQRVARDVSIIRKTNEYRDLGADHQQPPQTTPLFQSTRIRLICSVQGFQVPLDRQFFRQQRTVAPIALNRVAGAKPYCGFLLFGAFGGSRRGSEYCARPDFRALGRGSG